MQEATFLILTALAGGQPAWVRDHHRRPGDLGPASPTAGRDVVHGAGPAARGRADRGRPRGGRGQPAASLLPAHAHGRGDAGRGGGPVALQCPCRDVTAGSEWRDGEHMTNPSRLERRYRSLLALYPKAFRREHEQEILSVLMAAATEGQSAPGWQSPPIWSETRSSCGCARRGCRPHGSTPCPSHAAGAPCHRCLARLPHGHSVRLRPRRLVGSAAGTGSSTPFLYRLPPDPRSRPSAWSRATGTTLTTRSGGRGHADDV